jgi:hypothetical protein
MMLAMSAKDPSVATPNRLAARPTAIDGQMPGATHASRPAAALVRSDASPAGKPLEWTLTPNMSVQEWRVELAKLAVFDRVSPFLIGDCLRKGEKKYGVTYPEAARITRLDVNTLYKYVYVATNVEIYLRRRNLRFTHHELVASLDPDAQRYWLDRAEQDKMSVEDLRIELRTAARVKQQQHDGAFEGGERTTNMHPAGSAVDDPRSATSAEIQISQVIVCPKCGEALDPATVSEMQ